jgi:ABC-type nitrate/sulfonate/bicarbonate transport system substrate-binding protein
MRRAVISILGLAALLGCQKALPRKPEALQKITVSYTVQPQSTLVHVAAARGYFAEEGLEVRSLLHTFGKAALKSVLENQADFATVAETPVMFSVLRGDKIFVIANIEASTMNNGIVARTDAGISAPADLKGKRIGFTPGTTSDFFLDSMLTTIGITRQGIHPVALNPEDMLEAILGRKVDAVSTWNYPLTQIRQRLGPNGTIIYDREIYTETFNILARQDFVQEHPETLKRFLRALIKAEQFVSKDPEAAQSIMASAMKTEKNLIREVWSAFRYRVVLDQTLLITLEDETRWAMKNRLTDQTAMPDYRKFVHLDALRAVKPEAVKIPQ